MIVEPLILIFWNFNGPIKESDNFRTVRTV